MAKWLNAVLGGPCTFVVTHDGVPVIDPMSFLTTTAGVITLTTGTVNDDWTVEVTPDYLTSPAKFRMRAFNLSEPDAASAYIKTGAAITESIPLTVGPPTLPDPADFISYGQTAGLSIEEDSEPPGDTFSFVLEYDAEVADVFPIRGTLRAYRSSTTPMVVYVRTEEGPMDLSAVTELEAIVVEGEWGWWSGWWDYQNNAPWNFEIRVPAYSPEPGRVQFTIDRAHTRTRLWGSSHTLFVRADNRTIYSALLEIVG